MPCHLPFLPSVSSPPLLSFPCRRGPGKQHLSQGCPLPSCLPAVCMASEGNFQTVNRTPPHTCGSCFHPPPQGPGPLALFRPSYSLFFPPRNLQTYLNSRVLCTKCSSFWNLLPLVPGVESRDHSLPSAWKRLLSLQSAVFLPSTPHSVSAMAVFSFQTHHLSSPSGLPGADSPSFHFSDTLV